MKKQFKKAADALRHFIPNVDDPVWNYYRNTTYSDAPSISIPYRFYKNDQLIAELEFQCFPSPSDVAFSALAKILMEYPELEWTDVVMNNGPKRPKEEIMQQVEKANKIVSETKDIQTVSSAIAQLGKGMEEIKPEQEDSYKSYQSLLFKFSTAISLSHSRLNWSHGQPKRGLLQRLPKLSSFKIF